MLPSLKTFYHFAGVFQITRVHRTARARRVPATAATAPRARFARNLSARLKHTCDCAARACVSVEQLLSCRSRCGWGLTVISTFSRLFFCYRTLTNTPRSSNVIKSVVIFPLFSVRVVLVSIVTHIYFLESVRVWYRFLAEGCAARRGHPRQRQLLFFSATHLSLNTCVYCFYLSILHYLADFTCFLVQISRPT